MPPAPRPYHLALVADDPVFRLGLRIWLEQFSEFDLVIEADDGSDALRLIQTRLASQPDLIPRSETVDSETVDSKTVDLVVVDQDLGRADPSRLQGMNLCRQLRTAFPHLPILLLGTAGEPLMVAAAQQLGATGYCLKTAETDAIATALRQVARRQPYWPQAISAPLAASPARTTPAPPSPPPSPTLPAPAPLHTLKRHWRQSGIAQIDQAIAALNLQLCHLDLSLLDQAVLAGRRRELRTARWLVQRLLATPDLAISDPQLTSSPAGSGVGNPASANWRDRPASSPQPLQSSPTALATQPHPGQLSTLAPEAADAALTARRLRSLLFETILGNLQGGLENLTGTPLEIDILRSDKKSELFYLILRQLELLLDDLRLAQVPLNQLAERRSQLLLDLWQASTINFFGRYATVSAQGRDIEIVSELLLDAELIQTEILEKIPLFAELLGHMLYQSPLVIDSVSYTAGNPAAVQRADALLSHTVIQLANAVVQPLLNRFADVEAMKQAFYDRRLISSREIERFRNDLSWRYRLQRLLVEPRDIFESQYRLFTFCDRGIKPETIYSPRRDELEQLAGIPLVVTLVLETRDAVAPRLRTAVSFVGSGVVYILTEVIGRGIGLIGRGILKGVGSVVQDGRYGRNGERPR